MDKQHAETMQALANQHKESMQALSALIERTGGRGTAPQRGAHFSSDVATNRLA